MVAIKKIGYVSLCHNYIREKCWFEQVAEESNQWTGWWFQLYLFYRKIWEIPLTNISWLESWQPPPLRHGLLLGLKALTEETRRILCAGYRTRHFRTARRCSCDMTSWHTVERSAQSIARYDKWNSGFGCFWYLHQTNKNHLTFIDFYSLRRSNPLKPMDLIKHGWRPIFPASVSTEILAMTQIRKGLTP